MIKPRWRFVNQDQLEQQILIHDEESAMVLALVLGKVPSSRWVMQQEIGSNIEAAVESKPAPPVKAPPKPQSQPIAVAAPEAGVQPPPMKKKPSADKPPHERRTQQRFDTEFRVILIAGNSCFRTVSADVSLGGMKLKKRVPELFLNQSCLAYISHEDMRENIEMVCNIVGDPTDPCRVQFVNADSNQLKRFETWIQKRNGLKKVA